MTQQNSPPVSSSILIVAGKSGGHIIPGITVAQNICSKNPQAIFYFIAEDRPLDHQLLAPHTWLRATAFFALPHIARHRWWLYPFYMLHLIYITLRSLCVLHYWKPDQIISMGGLISVPVCCVARLLRIPYILYELNSEPGRAVQLLAKGASEVRCCSPRALRTLHNHNLSLVPYPLRPLTTIYHSPAQARQALGLVADRNTLYIMGGSQGSQALNTLILSWLCTLSKAQLATLQIIHQTGNDHKESMEQQYKKIAVKSLVFAYRHEVATCYQAATHVVTRAGAGALYELAQFHVPALIIPLITSSTTHQRSNARELAQKYPSLWTVIEQEKTAAIMAWLTKRLEQI